MADGTTWAGSASTSALPCSQTIRPGRSRDTLPAWEGVGLAVGSWPGSRQPASAICRLEADGRITAVTGVVDISGTTTGFAAIVAEGLGLSADDVSVISADTASAPRSPGEWRQRHHLLGRPRPRPRHGRAP